MGEKRDFRPAASAQFRIAGIKDRVCRFSQRYVRGVAGGECVAQLPNAAKQRRVRIALGGLGEKLFASMRICTPARNQSSNSTHHFYVEQMRNNE